MIQITPQAQITLQHPAFHLAHAEDSRIVALSKSGQGTFLAPDLTVLSTFSIPRELSQAALSPDGSLLAVTAADGITFYSTATFEKTHYMNDAFEWCLFGSATLFWTSSRFTELTAVLQAWDLPKKTMIAKTKVADPFAGSTFLLFPHPSPHSAVIWAAAGQDGQRLLWASLEGDTIRVSRFEHEDFTSPPAFSPRGTELLFTTEGQLFRYPYPNGPLLAKMNQVTEDAYIGDDVCYLDDTHALLTSTEGRLFVVDVVNMNVLHEAVIVGYEPRPTSALNPRLYPKPEDDHRLGSDLSHFVKLADGRFLSLHRDLSAANLDRACDRLMVWPAPAWR
jgi:hypothetical protein